MVAHCWKYRIYRIDPSKSQNKYTARTKIRTKIPAIIVKSGQWGDTKAAKIYYINCAI